MRYMNDLRPKLDYLDPRARERVLSALEVANVAHSGQVRKSGEPFIIHPIAVAAILADLRMDRDCIIAGLLHDTVEDTPVTLEDLETLFGTDVRRIVEGETKLSKLAKKVRSDPEEQQQNQSPTADVRRSATDAGPTDERLPAWQHERQKREEELQKQADNLRAMFIAMTEDVRVIIVKLADRLHNMRTLAHMSVVKQKKISKETLEFFAPLAHRLGMRRIKSELEELSFMYLHPEQYKHLKYEVQTMLMRSKFAYYLKSAEATVSDVLRQDRILYNMIRSVQVKGSTKDLYTIFRRMQAGENVSSMLDIATMQVVVDLDPGVDSNQACYHVLGRIHSLWKPLPKRLKDYIAFPKPNGYQSLHTTVLLGQKFDFLTMEIQIRTAEMDRIAEEGITAELFKATPVAQSGIITAEDEEVDEVDGEWRRRTTGWLISIREYIKEFSSSKDLVDAVRKDLLGNRVFVFTPKGNIVDLPKDSTPIDVAYRIHSDVGNSMIGAKVNGRIVSLDYKLQNADVVKIISSQFSKGPSPEWISYAKSRTARQKIRQFVRARDHDNMVDRGRRMLEDEARAMVEPVPSDQMLFGVLARLCAEMTATGVGTGAGVDECIVGVADLYVSIARGHNGNGRRQLERTALRLLREGRHSTIAAAGGAVTETEGRPGAVCRDVEAVLAPCCHPIRGDEVVGVRMCGGGAEAVVVHRRECAVAGEGGRGGCGTGTVRVQWAEHKPEVDEVEATVGRWLRMHPSRQAADDDGSGDGGGSARQPARVVVVAKDCTGLLAYITGVIASLGTPIRRCSTVTDGAKLVATLAFEVLVTDGAHLKRVVERVEECDEVELARRVEADENEQFFGDGVHRRCANGCGGQGCVDGCVLCDDGYAQLLREGQSICLRELDIEGVDALFV